MGWYTHIYVCVRNVKKKNSFIGHILSSFLNIILVFQLIFIGFSIHVYDEHIAGHFLQNSLQSTFYLLIYLTLTFMTIICLFVTILTPVARVPENYRVDDEKDKQLKLLTTQFDGKYVRSSTSKQNISKYTEILDEIANEKNIRMLERSRLGGYKYCYECQHLKPDRTKHCRSCGHCVLRYDHHCPYINKCINYNNYKSFCLYLFYSVLAVCWFFLSSCECVLRFVINANWEKDANSIIWIISFLIPISIFGFTIFTDIFLYHYDLICRNCTTAEEAGTYHMRYDKSASYDLGRKRNIQNIFGWGLWLFPFWTTLEDGLHYEIKTSPSSKFLIKRIICEE